MEVHTPRAAAVIVQRVPSPAVERFLEWQRGITAVAEGFAGYQGTDVYPPVQGQNDEWVAVIQFENAAALKQWLDSPVRADWVARLHRELGDFRLQMLPAGFGPWFADQVRASELPPGWKMVLSVLLGLYPTVMLLTLFVGPLMEPLGLAVAMLMSNALSVSLLQWLVMPVLNRPLTPWLKARSNQRITAAGLIIILLLLAGLTGLFHLVTG